MILCRHGASAAFCERETECDGETRGNSDASHSPSHRPIFFIDRRGWPLGQTTKTLSSTLFSQFFALLECALREANVTATPNNEWNTTWPNWQPVRSIPSICLCAITRPTPTPTGVGSPRRAERGSASRPGGLHGIPAERSRSDLTSANVCLKGWVRAPLLPHWDTLWNGGELFNLAKCVSRVLKNVCPQCCANSSLPARSLNY
jgi:hypothetical protein